MNLFSRSPLAGRTTPVLEGTFFHRIFGDPIDREFPDAEVAYLALGCFWGAEKLFWNTPGVLLTSVGYMGGETQNPTYKEVCSGRTGHAESVRVVFDPARLSYADVLAIFFENHDPTQGMRQGNDVGTQYRSAVYVTSAEQRAVAESVRAAFQPKLTAAGYGTITTEIVDAGPYYLAEDYHQQYLDANPFGYCPIHATGVTCQLP
ncbi:MAG TPA: peptide-methionine (S)-S-oxide reductase MsrA [Propionibacteriaceae bacterium]|nr:peptide-methionine (S)-S-oxide reductase MsrA [Propionibacteriaceae bacterium]